MTAIDDTAKTVPESAGTDGAATARRFLLEALDGGDVGVLDEILTEDYVDHSMPPGFPPNADGVRALFPQLKTAMPDARHAIELELLDRDYVVHHVRSQGTNTGPLFGTLPATGRSAVWNEMHIFRLRDGRIAEHWGVVKVDSIWVQLGLVEPPAGPVPPR